MSHPKYLRRLTPFALFLALYGCDGESPTTTTPAASAAEATSPVQVAGDPADRLARVLATALADPGVRRQVMEDLRDSPFPKHKIHLKSYLGGAQGSRVLRAAAVDDASPDQLRTLLDALPELEFYAPRSLDRIRWTGTEEVIVAASAAPLAKFARTDVVAGYSASGKRLEFRMSSVPGFPILFVLPAETDFGADPEAVRKAAPRQSRQTISTREEEIRIQDIAPDTTCDPNTETCSTSTTHGYILSSEYSWAACTSGLDSTNDTDQDGFRDSCEHELAYQFRPGLVMSPNDDAPTRESYWSVRRGAGTEIQIFYLIAYHRDAGEVNTGLTAHDGDSEFIIIRIEEAASAHWWLTSATLSAHWQTSGDATETVGYSSLLYVNNYRGRPDVYVARNKHANYKDRSTCDAGGGGTDTCDDNSGRSDVEVNSVRNVGNLWAPGGGLTLITTTYSVYGYPGWEEFWDFNVNFAGWQGDHLDAAGPYANSLYFYQF